MSKRRKPQTWAVYGLPPSMPPGKFAGGEAMPVAEGLSTRAAADRVVAAAVAQGWWSVDVHPEADMFDDDRPQVHHTRHRRV